MSPPYYHSPPIDLLDYPDGFANTKIIDLDAEYEEEQAVASATATATATTSTEVTPDGNTATEKKGTKQLYHIATDTQQRDMDEPIGLYGLYLSSYGPDPVNRVAVQLMSTFSKNNEGKDSEYDDYGSDDCYTGFACFNYGGTALSIMVKKIEGNEMNILRYLNKKGLLQKVLKLFEEDNTSSNNKPPPTKKLKQDDVIKRVQEFIDRK